MAADNIIQDVEELFVKLKKVQREGIQDQKKLDKKFRLEFNYNSSHLEGNTLTYSETELLLIFDKTFGNHELREYEELKAHDIAFSLIQKWAYESERPLTEIDIKELHKILLVRPYWKEAVTSDLQKSTRLIEVGDYKKMPNSVRLQNGEIFQYTTPEDTIAEMGELIRWFRYNEIRTHPVVLAALFHYKFVRIHPFDDGNGRMGRLLMNYVLLKNNFPPVVIKSADKSNYLFALQHADAGNQDAFTNYIAQQAIWSLELSIKAALGESLEEADDVDKEIQIFKKSVDKTKERRTVRSRESINTLIDHSIIRLFDIYIHKMRNFDSLFYKAEHRIVFSTTNSSTYNPKQRNGGYMLSTEQFPHSLKNFLNHSSKNLEGEILSFGLEYYFTGYKTSDPFDINTLLDVVFEPYVYSITRKGDFFPYDHFIAKNYDEMLSEDEIVFAVNDVAKETLKFLKERGR